MPQLQPREFPYPVGEPGTATIWAVLTDAGIRWMSYPHFGRLRGDACGHTHREQEGALACARRKLRLA